MAAAGGVQKSETMPTAPPPQSGGKPSSVRRRQWPEADDAFSLVGCVVMCLSAPVAVVGTVIAATLLGMVRVMFFPSPLFWFVIMFLFLLLGP